MNGECIYPVRIEFRVRRINLGVERSRRIKEEDAE